MRTILTAIAAMAALAVATATEAQTARNYGVCTMDFMGARGNHMTPIFTLNRDAVHGREIYFKAMQYPDEVQAASSYFTTDVQGEFVNYARSQGRTGTSPAVCDFGVSAQILKDWRASRPADYPSETSLLRNWRPTESAWAIMGVNQWEGE